MKRLIKYTAYTVAALLAATTTACTSAVDTPSEPDARPITFDTGGMSFTSASYARGQRGSETDAESATPIPPESVGVFGVIENSVTEIFLNQKFYYKYGQAWLTDQDAVQADWPTQFTWPSTNDWPYSPIKYWSSGAKYQFYCYAPHTDYEGAQVELTSRSFGNMTKFVYSHIPPYSATDYTISKAVVEHTGGTVPFDMQHLSARICVRLMIGEKYSRLRNIKIKEIKINDATIGATYYQCVKDLTTGSFTITPNGAYAAPADNQITLIPIFNDPDGLQLSADKYTQFGSLYVMPQSVTALIMQVTYDVYDLGTDISEPLLVRADQVVTNSVVLNINAESGKYYNVNLLVSPAYLYVLSDNDIKPTGLLDVVE